MSRRSSWILAGLIALTLAAYVPLWRNGFIDLDDEVYVTKNEQVKAGLTPRGIGWAFTTWHGGFWFPLTWLSLQLDASLFGGSERALAIGVHAQNLLWHLGTVVLLFLTWQRMTGATGPSAVVAALFAVHPLHVESVAWATERKDVLSTFFWMLTMLAYARFVEARTTERYLAMLAAFCLGLLAKPMLVTLPFALLLLDYWPLRRWPAGTSASAASLGRLVLEKLPLFGLAAGACVLTVVAQRHADAVVPVSEIHLGSRLANAVESYGWYLAKTFWPTNLAVFYTHPRQAWHWEPVLVSGAVLLAVSTAALLTARRLPWLLVGWLWFLGTLVPVIGLVQVGEQARGDRFVYVPHIGLMVAVVWTAAALLERLRVPALGQLGLAAGCVAALLLTTLRQVTHWENTETVWLHALDVTTRNHRAHANLGGELIRQAMRADQQRPAPLLERAEQEYEQAVAIEPNIVDYQYNLGCAHLYQDELAEAAERLRTALNVAAQRGTTHADAMHNLAVARLRLGRLEEAERVLDRALEAGGSANTRAVRGRVLWRQGRRDAALADWTEAHRQAPTDAEALLGLGEAALHDRREADAIRLLTEAARHAPGSAPTHSLLGIAQGRVGRWPDAVRSQQTAAQLETSRCALFPRRERGEAGLYQRRLGHALLMLGQGEAARQAFAAAAELDADGPRRDAERAFQLATEPDPANRDVAQAFELATQACEAQAEPTAAALDALAAAQAAAGRFEDATRTADQALAKAAAGEAAAIQARRRLYETRQPFLRAAKTGDPSR